MNQLPKALNDEIWNYCRANSITNVNDFIVKMVKLGFNIEKYGAQPDIPEVKKVEEAVKEAQPVIENKIETVVATAPKLQKDIYGEH